MSDYDPAEDARLSYDAAIEAKRDRLVAALVVLAEHGIPTDIQDLLVSGDPMRGIRPGALHAAIRAGRRTA